MHYSNSPKGTKLIRFLSQYVPNVRGKNYLLLRLASALNKKWPSCIRYQSGQGLIYELDLEVAGNRDFFFLGKYEADVTWVIENFLGDGDVVIEAGIDVGIHTGFMAKKVSTRGFVHAFDPLPSAIEDTRRHLSLNKLMNVVLNQTAVGEQEGKAIIYSFYNLPRAHSSLKNLGINHNKAQDCTVITIDDYVFDRHIGELKLIKLDIEGSEMAAVKGAMRSILNMRPLVVIEANDITSKEFGYQPKDIKEWFEKFSYDCFVLRRTKWINVIQEEEIKHGDNMLFIWKSDNKSLSKLNCY